MIATIATSPDGQWAVVRRGRELALLAAGAAPATARIELETLDADLRIVGPPSVLAVVTRGSAVDSGASRDRMVLYLPPYLEAVAQLDLDGPMRIAAVTGSRLVLMSPDSKAVIVRVAGRALSAHAIDPGSPVEFAVGLERNQVLFGLLRKLEVWDAVSGRPRLRMQLQLPPPPHVVGPAHGHLWAMQTGGDELLVYRLSDGRPFRHPIGSAIDEVIHHPASPVLVVATQRGLVRVHCFAHSVTRIDAPWRPGTALGQLVVGDDISLLGLADDADAPWRVTIAGAGAPAIAPDDERDGRDGRVFQIEPGPSTADPPRAMCDRADPEPLEPAPPPPPRDRPEMARADGGERSWREPLVGFAFDMLRGAEAEVPVVAADTEVGQLAHRLALPAPARRALIALYGLHLIGEPAVPIARLAHALGEWTEALGHGELGSLAMLRRHGGRLGLRASVSDVLDGVGPRAIRMVGGRAARAWPGAVRLVRDGKPDAVIESELAGQLGRIAVIEGGPALALLEARLHGATAVALAPPPARPLPWPRDSGLIVVADHAAPAWVAALPSFTGA